MSSKEAAKTQHMVYGGMMAALVFVATYFLKLPISLTQGYIHMGDGFILLGAALFGWLAIPAAAIGSMLADLFGGYTLYCLPTLMIKAAMALIAVLAFSGKKPIGVKALMLLASELTMAAGYFAVEWLILGYGLAAAAAALLPNLIQGLSGLVVAAVTIPFMRRVRTLRCR